MAMSHSLNITVKFLQDILWKNEADLVVTSFQVAAGSGRGDNYTAMLYRIRVHGVNSVTSETFTRSLIYKCLPDNPARREAFKSEKLFKNEVQVYTKALPAFVKFQGENQLFKAVPKCYLARSDVLVLEDLCARGFVMSDRKAGLNFQHCQAVIVELARFHGLSLAMKKQEPEKFYSDVAGCVREVQFCPEHEEWYRDYFHMGANNAVRMVEKTMADGEKKTECLKKLKAFVGDSLFFSRMMTLVSPKEPLAVLTHGDCWTNNILFRYSPDGEILEVCMVDFQLARYGSPALDITYLLYCSTSKELRDAHMDELLRIYHRELVSTIQTFSPEATDTWDADSLWDMIKEEVHEHGKYGMGAALEMIPISTCDSEQAPDLYLPSLEESGQRQGDGDANNTDIFSCNELCQRRMSELVQELVEKGDL